jgi:serine/threonine protein kinase
MPVKRLNKDEIFHAAAEVTDPAERAAFLDRICGADKELKADIRELLAQDCRHDSFFDYSAPRPHATEEQPFTEHAGDTIGDYKLLQQIGEGGMGIVWMAEQLQPIRRRVALKVIKPGMDSKQVLARFEAERQALAMMDHQNIAKVLDAGATHSGRPFFVMELVHGVPITNFCEANRSSVRERLELFIPVCQAIQHAHQKGVIHRDIKPSNILVTVYDDRPVPKVIDFGIAKAVDQHLTERTLFTQYGTIVGTLEYMSPEQAEMNALGVDTRSDVYSLGALLYQLLTGLPPLDRSEVRAQAWQDLIRRIKEEEPVRPSRRVSTSDSLAQFAQVCRTSSSALPRMLSRELDWIVMRCLEKNRTRRYETASGLARDVERYLADEPVEACPPTFLYRLQKIVRRHRLVIVTAAAFGVLLLVGLVVSLSLASWAWHARSEALSAKQTAEAALANETRALEEAQLARQEAELQVKRLKEATRLVNEARASESYEMWASAHEKYSRAIALEPNYHEAYAKRSELYARFGLWERMAADYKKRFQLVDNSYAVTHLENALLQAYVHDAAGYRMACLKFREQLKSSENPAFHQLLARAVAVTSLPIMEDSELLALADPALERSRHPYNLYVSGLAHLRTGDLEEAVRRLQEAMTGAEKSPEPVHRSGYAPLALALHKSSRPAEAQQALARAHQAFDETVASFVDTADETRKIPKTHDWLEFWLYLREAESVIRQQPLTEDARLSERTQTAWAMLTGQVQKPPQAAP